MIMSRNYPALGWSSKAEAIHGVFRRVFRVVFRRIENALVYIGIAIHVGRNTSRFKSVEENADQLAF